MLRQYLAQRLATDSVLRDAVQYEIGCRYVIDARISAAFTDVGTLPISKQNQRMNEL